MFSASQNLKRAASAELPETHPNKRQALERAASAEPQLPTERRKPEENDNAEEEEAVPDPGSETDPGVQPDQSSDDEADREGGEESGAAPDDGEDEDLPDTPRKKDNERSEWQKLVDKFIIHGNDTGFFSDDLRKKGHNSRPQMLPQERRRLMEDLAENSHTSEPESHPHTGLDFLSEFSTAVDNPKDAAAFLGVNLQSLEISPESELRLRIDQVQNIAFMVKKAEGILKGCVNANDYGTGKTVEALASIFFLAQRRQDSAGFGEHKAALILCPHQSLRGWQEVHAKYFSGLLTLRICSNSLASGQHSQLIDPPSPSALDEFLGTLLPSDPQTSRTVILCTYKELSSTKFLTKRQAEDVREKELSLRGSKLTEEALEAFKVAQKPELFDLAFDPAMIGTLIADDAHEIKHPRSRKAQTAYLLDADIQFLLTANPVDNKVSDFRGLLFALYKPKEWQINWPMGWKLPRVMRMFDDDFNPFKTNGSGSFVPHDASPDYIQALKNRQHLWRLNPHAYRWLAHQMKFSPEFSRRVLGSIYRLCLLRRGVMSVATMPSNGSPTISGILALPPVSIRTIEVNMGHEGFQYNHLANNGFHHIFQSGGPTSVAGAARVINGNETPMAAFNKAWDAFLSHITADLGLADLLTQPGSSYTPVPLSAFPTLNALLRNNTDSGMSFYYYMTRRQHDPIQPPGDRVSMIRHLVRRSPKLRWLLVKLEELKKRGEKAVVYCVRPLTKWLVEGVCSMAEFNFLSLKTKPEHGEETRAAVIADFINPEKRYDFLLSTMRVLGHGVDLHADCHNMIIFELPDSIPTMLSAIGRIRRVGQTNPQEVSILTMKDSYDDYTLYRQFRKHAISILAFGVLGERLDKLARRVNAQVERDRYERIKARYRRYRLWFWRVVKRDMSVLDVVKLLAGGELVRRHLGAQYNRSYVPWRSRCTLLFTLQRMKLVDFAGANMASNTETGRLILHLVAQLPATGPPLAGVGSLPERFKD